MRLNKFIAESGFCSRRKADELILEGRVSVNKHEAILGMDITDADTVRVDGERIKINTAIVQEYPIFKDEKAVLYNVSPVKYVLVPGPPFVIV